ncbi:MAG: hypothetical protein KGS48_09885 [Bacteroidetes bacterium]|nr:hypothetical protein [Bacteroidota bacterium]
MEEQNRQQLQDALSQLPQYEPPAHIWNELENALETRERLTQLPDYQAPDAVWTNIETRLPRITPKSGATRRLRFLQLAVAALWIGVIGITAWWMFEIPDQDQTIAQTQEIADPNLFETVQAPEDSAFAIVDKLCENRISACETPAFSALKSELEELSDAKERLRSALGNFNDDPALTEQLVRIELERSAILKQMMQLI